MATKKAPAKKTAAPVAAKSSAAPAKKTSSTKKMTKSELVKLVAEKMELSAKQVAAFFDLLASTAIQETKKNGEFCQGRSKSGPVWRRKREPFVSLRRVLGTTGARASGA